MNSNELKEVLDKHTKWLRNEKDGVHAYLSRANLSGADLSGADLSSANLSSANLSRADLSGAYLSGANLSRADLSGADLSGAYLSRADLSGADLSGTDLSGTDLSGAYLSGTDLSCANLSGTDLSGADQKTIDYILSFTSIVPSGTMQVWKAGKNSIIQLEIPSKANRVNYIGSRKCRAEYAKVKAILSKIDGKKLKETTGLYKEDFVYKVGEIVRPDSYDPSPLNECSHGIHFFLTRHEAERWNG